MQENQALMICTRQRDFCACTCGYKNDNSVKLDVNLDSYIYSLDDWDTEWKRGLRKVRRQWALKLILVTKYMQYLSREALNACRHDILEGVKS